jgi:hypothetical protein
MAIEDPSRNPFLGIYQRQQGGQASNVGMGQPQDFLSSEEVIGRPDAQNTAQRSKASSKGLKDAYDAVVKGAEGELVKKVEGFGKTKPSFTGAKKAAFDAVVAGRPLTPAQEAIVNANFGEFQAAQSVMMGYQAPRELMAMGKSETTGQLGQSSSTANVASQYEVAYDKSGNPFRQERKSATMLPANVSRFETLGFGVPKGYSTSTQTPLNLPMTQGQLDKKLSDEEAARAKAIIESHK